jgi:hypothetical protein
VHHSVTMETEILGCCSDEFNELIIGMDITAGSV